MATLIRAEISKKNKYWIDKHRHYELKHFCLQYPLWKKMYSVLSDSNISMSNIDHLPNNNLPSDPTARRAILKAYYSNKMRIIEDVAIAADPCLHKYILRAVTENLSYTYLKTILNIPCGKDMYYEKYRKFFWLLSNSRE